MTKRLIGFPIEAGAGVNAAGVSLTKFNVEKRCCSVCDRKKVCHVCGDQTLMACSDCRINLGATVYVCGKRACREHHERLCSGTPYPLSPSSAAGHQLTAETVTPENASAQIERRMGDLVDLLAFFVNAKINPRAWQQLLIYAPRYLYSPPSKGGKE